MADSGFQNASGQVRTLRERMMSDDEPLYSDTRTVQQHNTSLYANLMDVGVSIHNIEAGDEVNVEVYPEGICIPFNDE